MTYSALHNLKPGTCYPATMITTADHDGRVVPPYSFKFAATAQAARASTNPVVIRIDTKAGHGAGQADEQADRGSGGPMGLPGEGAADGRGAHRRGRGGVI